MSFALTRYSCIGNTFLLWDGNKKSLNLNGRAGLARLVCSGFQGFWNDGFIYYERQSPTVATWDFYNADGSKAEMCGNAARALIAELNSDEEVQVSSEFLNFSGRRSQDEVAVRWKLPGALFPQEVAIPELGDLQVWTINTGVPHALVEGEPDLAIVEKLRNHPLFGAAGTNVTFFLEAEPHRWQAATFERGVEDFTLGCGTGAIAVAQFARLAGGGTQAPQQIEMPGGLLRVEVGQGSEVILIGPADREFQILLNIDSEED